MDPKQNGPHPRTTQTAQRKQRTIIVYINATNKRNGKGTINVEDLNNDNIN